jgi:hypothetical protein
MLCSVMVNSKLGFGFQCQGSCNMGLSTLLHVTPWVYGHCRLRRQLPLFTADSVELSLLATDLPAQQRQAWQGSC